MGVRVGTVMGIDCGLWAGRYLVLECGYIERA